MRRVHILMNLLSLVAMIPSRNIWIQSPQGNRATRCVAWETRVVQFLLLRDEHLQYRVGGMKATEILAFIEGWPWICTTLCSVINREGVPTSGVAFRDSLSKLPYSGYFSRGVIIFRSSLTLKPQNLIIESGCGQLECSLLPCG